MTFFPRPLLASCLLLALALPAAGEVAAVPSESEERFQREIRPILSRNCLACHGGETRQSGLVLESVAEILKGGALSGPAVLAGQSSASPLIQYLTGEKEPRMPLTGSPLPEADIAAISQWIDEMQVAAAGGAKEPSLSWPWTPLGEPALPEVRNRSWVRNEVDAFILAKLEEEGMVPAPPASDRARLRRIYFGLIGLPPTPEEAERFLGEPSPEAFRLEIERLLSRPEYGVRWGRHWLDLVRYADTGGESTDDARSHLWRYRDYVIRAFNQDRPYDRFIKEQIAGDAYRHYGDEAKLGTGFLYQWIPVQRDRGPERRRDVLNDVVGTTGSVFLGMTVGCARCHDHKYDPLPTRDYYRLEAFFAPLLLKATPVSFTEFELAGRQPEVWKEKAAAWDGVLESRKGPGRTKERGVQGPYEGPPVAGHGPGSQGLVPGHHRYRSQMGHEAGRALQQGGAGPLPAAAQANHPLRQPQQPGLFQAHGLHGFRLPHSAFGEHLRAEGWQLPLERGRSGARLSERGDGALRSGESGGAEQPPQGAGRVDRQSRQSPHRQGDGESHLAVPLRHGAGAPTQRSGEERRRDPPPRAHRLAGLEIHPERVGASSRSNA